MVTTPVLSLGRINARLILADSGAALANETITLTTANTVLCSAVTNRSGVATCRRSAASFLLALLLGYTAIFSGTADYLPSTAGALP